jgi:predicted permease
VLHKFRHALRAMRAGERLDGQLDTELQFHIDLQARKLVEEGMPPDQARTAALRQFGGVERVREECRDSRGIGWAEGPRRAVTFAMRTLRRQPGFTCVSVLVLGLGIGANTAMFSLIEGVLLKPLPYTQGDRLVLVQESAPLAGQDNIGISIPELYDYRKQLTGFAGLVEFHQMSFDLLERGEPDRVATGVVSANFFDVLGVRPVVGRTFVAADEALGAPAVLVLSHAYWQTRFGGDPHIVGQVFQMNDRPHTVVGVLPQIPQYPAECDVYMPTSACPFRAAAERRIAEQRRAFGGLQVFGRLKPGVLLSEARAQVDTVAGRFRLLHPDVYRPGQGFRATTVDLLGELTRNVRPILLMLLGATGLVLLIACANIASLSLARALNREREFALRAALGAGRRQLAAQLLTESLLLALAGGALGVALAWATIGALTTFAGRFTPRIHEISLDGGVLAFTLGLSLLTGLLFGAIPALTTRPAPASALKQSGAGGVAPRRRRLQHALVVAQVSVSVVLLVAAGLLLASVVRLQRVDAGYRSDRVLSAEVFGNFSRYKEASDFLKLYEPLVARLSAEPGVISAAITSAVPLSAVEPYLNPFQIEGHAVADPDRRPPADYFTVSNAYFDTLAIPVVKGRTFQNTDRRDSTAVAVISRSMARYWDKADPLGTRVSVDGGETWLTVVGIVGDVRQRELDREPIAQIYTPLSQTQGLPGRVLVRTSGDPIAMAGVIRAAVRAIDPNQPVENVQTLEDVRSTQLATPRLTALLLTLFAGLALLVTLAGIGGVIATMVSQRTQEFGIRMALGASRGAVLRVVLVQGLSLVCAGLVIGLVASGAVSHLLAKYLFETGPTDMVTLAVVALTCIVAGIVACLGPARRAVGVDPMVALRAE